MEKNLHAYRKSYEKFELVEDQVPQDPFILFANWFGEAEEAPEVDEANAMTVSTVGLDGFPKSRIVLLKQFDRRGFVFFTNYNSEKGKAIETNPKLCLSFFWPGIERQAIIKGVAEKTNAAESDAYFHSRPRGSQLGALASNQSHPINSREVLAQKMEELENQYQDQEIPRPEHWGGYLVVPQEFEFWQGRPNRLHDRLIFRNEKDQWQLTRLAP